MTPSRLVAKPSRRWLPWPKRGLLVDQQGRSQALLEPGQREVRVWMVAERRGVYAEVPSRLVCYGPLAWFACEPTLMSNQRYTSTAIPSARTQAP